MSRDIIFSPDTIPFVAVPPSCPESHCFKMDLSVVEDAETALNVKLIYDLLHRETNIPDSI